MTRSGKPVRAGDIGAAGAMAALMKHAMQPNLVQTIEGVPALVHGGPFANIAHGCNTLVATKLARKLADYTVTEAGFAADLGAEKFFHIKCRIGGIAPAAGGAGGHPPRHRRARNRQRAAARAEPGAIRGAGGDLRQPLPGRPAGRAQEILAACRDLGVPAAVTDYRESGGEGGLDLAELVVKACDMPSTLTPLYPLEMPLDDKVRCLAVYLYGADGVDFSPDAQREIKQITNLGYGGCRCVSPRRPTRCLTTPSSPAVQRVSG
jgi:formate--tetrahydrofolate ligase